ncbi:MAG: hypothetical protein AAGG75_05460 [Bacteroidota bacterium]
MKKGNLLFALLLLLGSIHFSQAQTGIDSWYPAKYNVGDPTYRYGNVGIGTAHPGVDLHIFRGLREGGGKKVGSTILTSSGNSTIRLESMVPADETWPPTYTARAWDIVGGSMLTIRGASNIMYMTYDEGRVGIGRLPSTKLDVDGKVTVRELPESTREKRVVVANDFGRLHGRELAENVWDGDNQHLELDGFNLMIEDGNAVDLSIFEDNQTLTLNGNILEIEDGNSVDLSIFENTPQTLSLSGSVLTITGGNSVDFGSLFSDERWHGPNNTNGHIHREGTVSIGTDHIPQGAYMLAVTGGILTEEVKVELCNDNGWCDYVFNDDYALQSLEEVEQHIEEKGHLHNTPSGAEIEAEGGFELKAATLNQQEKIEELFLHMIAMNKEVKALKKQVKELKAKLESK